MKNGRDGWFYDEPQRERSRAVLGLSCLIVLGWLVYELTAQPALGSALIVAKFGWSDFVLAFWLRRIDPHRGRGFACFWLHVASSFRKIGLSCTLFMGAVAVISKLEGKAKMGPISQVVLISIIMIASSGASALSSWLALWFAWRNRLKLWLGGIDHARRNNRWPSFDRAVPHKNMASYVVHFGLAMTAFLYFPAAVAAATWLGARGLIFCRGVAPGNQWVSPVLGLVIAFTLVLSWVVGAIALATISKRFSAWMCAMTPAECWGVVDEGWKKGNC
jgi:hypothetical protein